ncbi:sce7726 family protein [Shinella zoogloeoides]|uniref:sce7726 family protein n=1 Tax=Shinella zoogloeoides TaxID=352475 RepID=UPI000E6548C4|nr:sce7726 family protein [Shinella zoogloeoides]
MDIVNSRATEATLKAKFLEFLLSDGKITRRSLVSNEYQVHGATRRADLAILERGRFVGVEIKSEFDSLSRLQGQTAAYLQVFDDVYVLVAEKHRASAAKMLCAAVSLYSISDAGFITEVRGRQSLDRPDEETRKSAILHALPKTTLQRLAMRFDGRHSRRELMEVLRGHPLDELRSALLAEFKQRYSATSKSFWALVSRRRTVAASYLPVLSRFASTRKRANDHSEEQKSRWELWLSRRQSAHPS